MPEIVVCSAAELPPGQVRIAQHGDLVVGVFNLGDRLCALEDRCSHDDGPLAEGDFDPEEGVVVCPRHGSEFEVCSGRPRTLPAYIPVETFPARVDDGNVLVELPDER
jgi:3-phenylpropionate/trans-cinnamate dioxygenase ferredoxin component